MRRRRRGASFALCAAFLCVALPAAGAGPEETMRATIDEVLVVLNDASLDFERRLASIEAIAYASFDMPTMSRLVLGRARKRFSEQQRQEYLVEFKKYLANNYGSRINRYDQEQVEIIDVRDEPRGDATVRTRIVGGEYDGSRVDYRMRRTGDSWKVIDIIIENVGMVSNFGDQFGEVLSRGGPDHLIEKLREKNALGPVEE